MGSPVFSVYQFFANGSYERVKYLVSAEEAVATAVALSRSVGARHGTTLRLIITDGGDSTTFEWVRGKGIVWPPELAKPLPPLM